jgi:O-antigen ligase
MPLLGVMLLGLASLAAVVLGLPVLIQLAEYLLSGGEKSYAILPLLAGLGFAVYVVYLLLVNRRQRLFLVLLAAFPLISVLHRRVAFNLAGMEFFLETALVLVLAVWLWNQRRLRSHPVSSLVYFLGVSLAAALMSLLINRVLTPATGWYVVQEMVLPTLLFFLTLSMVRHREDLNRVLRALFLSLVVFGALSLAWIFVLDQTIELDVGEVLAVKTRISGGVRRLLVGAGFVNSEVGNRVFLLLLPVAAVLVRGRRLTRDNALLYLVILASAYFIIATEHRAALLGGVLVLLLFLLFGKTRNVKLWMKLAVLGLAVALLHEKIYEYLGRRILLEESIMMDGSAQKRLIMWSFALDLVRSHPLFGIGPLQYLSAAMNTRAQAITPHNYYVTVLTELGVVGLLGYLGMVGSLFVRGWRNSRHLLDPALRRLNFGLAMGLFYYQFVLFFGGGRLTHNNSIYIHSLFWVVAALLWVLPRVERDEARLTAAAAAPPAAGREASGPPLPAPLDGSATDPGL